MKHELFQGETFLKALKESYAVTENDCREFSAFSKKGMHFQAKSYEFGNIGHYCILTMSGMLGLMKMETLVFSVYGKDVPLFNIDSVTVFKQRTQLMEFYDTRLGDSDESAAIPYFKIKERDNDLPDYISGEHWYDPILLPCSYGKKAKGKDARLIQSSEDYFGAYLDELKQAKECDGKEKKEKNRAFAEGLLHNGGPAVDQVTKLFGKEFAVTLILDIMYGVK